MGDRIKKIDDIYKSMKVELVEKKVEDLVVSNEREYIDYKASYQRNYKWSESKATNFIETVLMNGIVPPLIVLKNGKTIIIVDRKTKI